MKAWRVVWSKMPKEPGIVIAKTRGKAIARTVSQITEAGWSPRWPDIRCQRAPEYDQWAARQPERIRNRCLAEEYLVEVDHA